MLLMGGAQHKVKFLPLPLWVNNEWIVSTISSPVPYSAPTASPHKLQSLAHVAQAGDTPAGAVSRGEALSLPCHPLG